MIEQLLPYIWEVYALFYVGVILSIYPLIRLFKDIENGQSWTTFFSILICLMMFLGWMSIGASSNPKIWLMYGICQNACLVSAWIAALFSKTRN